jgi:glycerol-3-phosphate cytidylyltransferase
MGKLKNNIKLYTGGTFDLFHSGHVNFLKHCKKIANTVIVALNTDEFVERYKGKKPIISYEDRKSVLLSSKYVDEVIENINGEDSKPTILSSSPNIIAIGDDWAKKDYYKQMNFTQQWLDENDITLIYVPYKEGISSTEIKKKLLDL